MDLWRRRGLVGALACGLGPAAVCAPPPLRFATDANDQSGLAPGGRAVLQRAFERLGLAVRFEPLPLRRSLQMAEQGALDGETLRIGAVARDHPSLLLVPVAIAKVKVLGYVRGPAPRDWPDLRTLRVGYPRGVVLLEALLADVPRKVEATTHAELLRMLRADIVDIALLTLAADQPEPDIRPLPGLNPLPKPLSVTPLHALLHARHRELLPRLTAVLQDMEDSGESARLRRAAWAAEAGALKP